MSHFQWRKEKIFVSSLSNIVIQQLDLQGFFINLDTVYEAADKYNLEPNLNQSTPTVIQETGSSLVPLKMGPVRGKNFWNQTKGTQISKQQNHRSIGLSSLLILSEPLVFGFHKMEPTLSSW